MSEQEEKANGGAAQEEAAAAAAANGGGSEEELSQEEKDKKIQDLESEVQRLREKETNFGQLRKKRLSELSQEERDKLSAKEQEIMARQDALDEKWEQFQKSNVDETIDVVLTSLVGADENMRKKIMHFYDELKGSSDNKDQIRQKLQRAYVLATTEAPKVNPLAAVMPMHAPVGTQYEKPSFDQTERGKRVLTSLGGSYQFKDDAPRELPSSDPTQV